MINIFVAKELYLFRSLVNRLIKSNNKKIIKNNNNNFIIRKTIINLKKFGSNNNIWRETFINYIFIINFFHGRNFPIFINILISF
jgi:hypothetical protein